MTTSGPSFKPLPKALVVIAVTAVAVYLFSMWFRLTAIENAAYGSACLISISDGTAGLGCRIWNALIPLFNNSIFGWLAVGFAIVALWRPHHATVALALFFAAAGLALYNVALSSLAIAMTMLTLARPTSATA